MNAYVLFVLLALAATGFAQTYSTNFTTVFSGGLAFCSQCSTPGQYACSPDKSGAVIGQWNSGIVQFIDPTPSGSVPHGIRLQLFGAWSCDPTTQSSMYALSVNGYPLAVRDNPYGQTVNPCKCDTCDTADTLSISFRNGIPFYNKDGSNRFQLVIYRNNICVNRIVITIDYQTTNTELPHVYVPINDFKPNNATQTCKICNNGAANTESTWCSTYSSNTLTFSVTNPVPSGAILVGVDVHLSYNMVQRSTGSLTTAYFSLLGDAINTLTISDSSFRQQCGCLDNIVAQSPFYQRGWPNYAYNAKNTFSIFLRKYNEYYGNICIGRLGVDFIYYFP